MFVKTNIFQTLRVNNLRILGVKNAKFSGYYYHMNINIQRIFQICISVPLILQIACRLCICYWGVFRILSNICGGIFLQRLQAVNSFRLDTPFKIFVRVLNTSLSLFLTVYVPCISGRCIKIKIKLNFYFHTSLWCL